MANKTWVGTTSGSEGDWGVAGNWSPSGVPVAADNVRIPAGSYAITGSLNQSAVALGLVIVERGHTQTIGSSAGYLQLTCTRFEYDGSGVSYIDLSASAIPVTVHGTANVSEGYRGLYLKGSAITVLTVNAGDVGLAVKSGETSTVTTARCMTGLLILGAGVTATTVQNYDGEITLRCACTTLDIYGGKVTSEEVGTITTVNLMGGDFIAKSTGTITTVNAKGGTLDETQSGAARTFSTVNLYRNVTWKRIKEAVTVTTLTLQESMSLTTADAI